MNSNNTGYIIGAYPCAPSFHQKSEEEETEFWRQLSDTPDIRGLEQPCLEHLHPLGDEWLLRHTPGHWQIVVTRHHGNHAPAAVKTAALGWHPATKSSAKPAWSTIVTCSRRSLKSMVRPPERSLPLSFTPPRWRAMPTWIRLPMPLPVH
ncbi:chemotaxis protein [Klebsiella michiganensis]|nr:chemotaxis protein [Klebsiella michiganensis]